MVWTSILGTVTGASHPLSSDIAQWVEWIQFSWPFLTHDTPLVLLWPGRHWNNIWKGIRHRQQGSTALMNSDNGAAGTCIWLVVSLLCGTALSPEEVVRLYMCEWGPCSGYLFQAYLMLTGCVDLHYPLLNISFSHVYIHTSPYRHTNVRMHSDYQSQWTMCNQSGTLKVLPPVSVPVINWPINVCLFWTPMDVAILGLSGKDASQTDKSKHCASVLACAKRFPRNPPLSQLGLNVRPFHSQSGQIFVSSSLPMHLTLTRLIALCTGQTCYLLV